MRKVLFLTFLTMFGINTVNADTVIIMDDNNNVKQQIYTYPNTTVATTQTAPTVQVAPAPTAVQTQPIYVNSVSLPPQQVIVTRPVPPVVVVRETPFPRNYYYDSAATAVVAGFTGALVGGLVFGHPGHHHHRPHRR